MAQPTLPIQQGGNLPSLDDHEDQVKHSIQEEHQTEAIADALDLDEDEAEHEVIELDDGSVIVNLEEKKSPQEDPEFYENLAEVFDEDILQGIAVEYLDFIDVDKESRKERDKQYEEGLRRTGLGKDAPGGATFDGASKVVHPVMAESCVDFAASSSKELLPSDGIVKSNIKGTADKLKEDTANRKVSYLNWQLTEQVQEYRDEMEQLLTQLPLGGSQFLKWRYDNEQKRPTCEWVPIDNIYLPYSSTNFYTAQRVTEVQDITEDVYRQRIEQGIYRDADGYYTTSDAPLTDQTRSEKANDKIEGKDLPSENIDGLRRVYEITCFMRLDDDPITKGKRAPYILMIDESSSKVLGLYRNWESNDEKLEKLDWYVEFKFIPWRGAYAIGLPHLIGGLSAALTGSLRAILDAAHINNSQTMLKLKGGRIGGQSDRIEPTQVIEIEGAPGVDDVRKIAMPMPFNPPSPTLFNLIGWLTNAAKGVVTTAEEKIGDVNSNTPVGTTQALIEQGAKVFSSIHARLHRSQAKSLAIISRLNHWYLSEMDNQSGEEIEVRDFAYNNDVRPISDPNIFSETQRLAQNQALLQMAHAAPPGMFNLRETYYRVLNQLKIPAIDEVLPNPQGAAEANPALENVAMTMGRPAAAYPDQDHMSHIKIHLEYANNPAYGGSPVIGPTFSPLALDHIKQHLTLHYLQSMRAYVAQAAGGKDVFGLHEEKPMDLEAQQALAVASELVGQDAQATLQQYSQQIVGLAQKVQQMQQAQQQQMAANDPTAQVILKTQMAETQRKAAEAQAKMQLEMGQDKQNYQLEVAKLQQQMAELQAKYQTQSTVDSQRNATQIALADINNSSRERVASINAHAQLTADEMAMQHEQEQTALMASHEAQQDIRQHGLEIEQQTFTHQAQMAQQAAQQAAQADQQRRQHVVDLVQQQLDNKAAMQQQQMQQAQQPAAPQEPQQPTT
jgi:chaperonin GroES